MHLILYSYSKDKYILSGATYVQYVVWEICIFVRGIYKSTVSRIYNVCKSVPKNYVLYSITNPDSSRDSWSSSVAVADNVTA